MSAVTAAESAGGPPAELVEEESNQLVLTEIKIEVAKPSYLWKGSTISATIDGNIEIKDIESHTLPHWKEEWKDQHRIIPPGTAILVKWTSKKDSAHSAEVTYAYADLLELARNGIRRCVHKNEGVKFTIRFDAKKLDLSQHPAVIRDALRIEDQRTRLLDRLGKAETVLNAIKDVGDVAKSLHPAIQVTVGCLGIVAKALEKYRKIHERILSLITDMVDVVSYIGNVRQFATVPKLKAAIQDVNKPLEDAIRLIISRHERPLISEVHSLLSGSDEDEISKLEECFKRLKSIFHLGVDVQVLSDMNNLMKQFASSSQDEALLQSLDPRYEPPARRVSRCLDGTRKDILAKIHTWANDLEAPNVLWISAYPGTGKSTIASHVAKDLAHAYRLGSFFSFDRSTSTATPSVLWRMNSTKLANEYPTCRPSIISALQKCDPGNSTSRELFRQLVLEPLRQWGSNPADISRNRLPVIVIDALDECTSDRRALFQAIQEWTNLPRLYKLIVTSRSEGDILDKLSDSSRFHNLHIEMGDNVSQSSTGDIRLFFEERFKEIRESCGCSSSWPGESVITELTRRAAGIFIWAVTLTKFVAVYQPERRLEQIQGVPLPGGDVHALYTALLNSSESLIAASSLGHFQDVVGAIVITQIPVESDVLSRLTGVDLSAIKSILQALKPVLEAGNAPIFAHRSFVDFLIQHEIVSNDKSKPVSTQVACPEQFRIYRAQVHQLIFDGSFRVMIEGLHFNVCNIPSSFMPNSTLQKSHFDDAVEPTLRYACKFWGVHLAGSPPGISASSGPLLSSFLHEKLLFWLEALSGLGAYGSAFRFLATLKDHLADEDNATCSHEHDRREFIRLVSDALSFCRYFGPAISFSAPHTYLSTLPFAPGSSTLLDAYAKHYMKRVSLKCGVLRHWPALQMRLQSTDRILSVAFSPDGKSIASGSSNGTVCIWNVETGQAAAGPFEGHTSWVCSVAFSPDGKSIASSSYDGTIRIWNIETGQAAAGLFEGHEDRVTSVAFSPDGKSLASSSWDRTVRIWNVETGQAAAGPFEGHENWVTSVAFSPDGKSIASGSDDGTICIWNVETGQVAAGPFQGHEYSVTSIAFSPDSENTASGSGDGTVHIWNIEMGRAVAGPFEGHTDWVSSVAFSPDSKSVASGSGDGTVRIWNVETGQAAAGPFAEHGDWVTSVAFSPDGKSIASGSYDRTVSIWNVEMGQATAGSFEGHDDLVTSVVFSPDGKSIASSSDDGTIRIWNVETGQAAAGPFRGHENSVNSVAFSPDGKSTASGSSDRTVRIWNVETGQAAAGPFRGHENSVTSVAFSPDGKSIASGSYDRTVRIWNIETSQAAAGPFKGHENSVTSVAFSPNGKSVASGSDDGTIRIWNVETGKAAAGPFRGHENSVSSVAFSPDGRSIASGSGDGTVRIWSAETGQVAAATFEGHETSVTSVAFSPDGKSIASGSDDRTVRIWNVETGQVVAGTFEGHETSVTSVVFSPDGKSVASGSYDRTIRVWDVSNLTCSAGQRNQVQAQISTADCLFPHFTNQTRINVDGWVLGPNGELLFWVPPLHRAGLYRPSNQMVIEQYATRLDFTNAVWGESWTDCYTGP